MAPWESVPSAREVVSQLQASGGEKDAKGVTWTFHQHEIAEIDAEKNGTLELEVG